MKKVYFIGAGTGLNAIKEATIVLNPKEDIEIICVNSIEDVPLEERIKSDPAVIQYSHKFTARQELTERNMIDIRKDKKKKGHERPYKFHR